MPMRKVSGFAALVRYVQKRVENGRDKPANYLDPLVQYSVVIQRNVDSALADKGRVTGNGVHKKKGRGKSTLCSRRGSSTSKGEEDDDFYDGSVVEGEMRLNMSLRDKGKRPLIVDDDEDEEVEESGDDDDDGSKGKGKSTKNSYSKSKKNTSAKRRKELKKGIEEEDVREERVQSLASGSTSTARVTRQTRSSRSRSK